MACGGDGLSSLRTTTRRRWLRWRRCWQHDSAMAAEEEVAAGCGGRGGARLQRISSGAGGVGCLSICIAIINPPTGMFKLSSIPPAQFPTRHKAIVCVQRPPTHSIKHCFLIYSSSYKPPLCQSDSWLFFPSQLCNMIVFPQHWGPHCYHPPLQHHLGWPCHIFYCEHLEGRKRPETHAPASIIAPVPALTKGTSHLPSLCLLHAPLAVKMPHIPTHSTSSHHRQ